MYENRPPTIHEDPLASAGASLWRALALSPGNRLSAQRDFALKAKAPCRALCAVFPQFGARISLRSLSRPRHRDRVPRIGGERPLLAALSAAPRLADDGGVARRLQFLASGPRSRREPYFRRSFSWDSDGMAPRLRGRPVLADPRPDAARRRCRAFRRVLSESSTF